MLNRKEYCSTDTKSLESFKVLGCVSVMTVFALHPATHIGRSDRLKD